MTQKRVTIFGGGGFVGRYIVRLLAKEGWIVRIAQRRPNDALFLIPAGSIGQIELVKADIKDEKSIKPAIENAQAIINLVGILAPSSNGNFDHIHVQGAAEIARIGTQEGVEKIVHFSALGADPRSRSAYARSKAKGEEALLRHFSKATILRPSIIFGPEDGFFNRFAKMATISPIIPLIGGGNNLFQPTDVRDIAMAAFHALTYPETQAKIYELGGPDQISFKDLMKIMLHEIRKARILLPIPFSLSYLMAAFMQCLPGKPLTIDQVRLLEKDNIVSGKHPGYREMGIEPNAITSITLSYLSTYRSNP